MKAYKPKQKVIYAWQWLPGKEIPDQLSKYVEPWPGLSSDISPCRCLRINTGGLVVRGDFLMLVSQGDHLCVRIVSKGEFLDTYEECEDERASINGI